MDSLFACVCFQYVFQTLTRACLCVFGCVCVCTGLTKTPTVLLVTWLNGHLLSRGVAHTSIPIHLSLSGGHAQSGRSARFSFKQHHAQQEQGMRGTDDDGVLSSETPHVQSGCVCMRLVRAHSQAHAHFHAHRVRHGCGGWRRWGATARRRLSRTQHDDTDNLTRIH